MSAESGARPYDVAILGAGPSGLFAAFYARMREMRALVIDALPEVGGQLTALYPEKEIFDVPGFPAVRASVLAGRFAQQAESGWVDVHLQERCETLERGPDGFVLGTQRGSYCARTVVIAAGVGSFEPTRLGLENEQAFEGRGLYYYAKHFEEFVDQDVVVVGGGDSAVDWANALCEHARSLTLVHRRDAFRAHDASVNELRCSRTRIRAPGQIVALHADDNGNLAEVTLREGESESRLPCTRLILALGFKANIGPLREWGLELQGNHIIVDGMQRTSVPGVFAAGDVCLHPEYGNLKLIVVGQAQAAIAISAAKMYLDPDSKLFPGHSSANSSLQHKL